MERYALCFYGYFGKQKEDIHTIDKNSRYYQPGSMKNLSSQQLNPICSIRHFQQYVINYNPNVDVFFHCWNTDKESQELLLNEYNPVSYLFEDQTQPDFNYTYDYKNTCNIPRFYSEEQSLQLVRDYEKTHKIHYRLVMHSIFDNLFLTPINLVQLQEPYIYTLHYNQVKPKIIKNNYWFKKKKYILKNNISCEITNQLHDQWYIGSTDNLQKICQLTQLKELYRKFPYKQYGGHYHRYQLIKQEKIEHLLKFILYEGVNYVKINQIFLPELQHCLLKVL